MTIRKPGNPCRRKKGRKPAYTLAELFYRRGGRCKYCGGPTALGGEGPNMATRDHVRPRSKGGKQAGNLVLACFKCNNAKGSGPAPKPTAPPPPAPEPSPR